MDWLDGLLLAAKFFGAVGVIVGFFASVHKYFVEPLRTTARMIKLIEPQFRPNGGTSWDDKISATAKGVESIKDTLRQHIDRVAMIDARSENTMSELELGNMNMDVHGQVVHVNMAALRHASRSKDELLGFGWLTCICEADQARIQYRWLEHVSKQQRMRDTFAWQKPNGELSKVVSFQSRPFFRPAEPGKEPELIGHTACLRIVDAPYWPLPESLQLAEVKKP